MVLIRVSKHFDEQYQSLEELKKNLYEKIEHALQDIDNGKYKPANNFFKEMEAKYNINE